MASMIRSRQRRQRAIAFDDGLAGYLQQLIDVELARRAETATVAGLPKQLPVEPLVRLVEGRGGLYACLGTSAGREVDRLDRMYRRASDRGHLSWKAADQLAIELLGLHPMLVWGDDWVAPIDTFLAESSVPALVDHRRGSLGIEG